MVYQSIVEGKVFVTNVKNITTGVTRIEVYSEKEFLEIIQASWWNVVLNKFFKK